MNSDVITEQQVIALAIEAGYPMERCGYAETMLIGPHFVSHLVDFAKFAVSFGRSIERESTVALLLSPEGRRLAGMSGGIERLAATIQAGGAA